MPKIDFLFEILAAAANVAAVVRAILEVLREVRARRGSRRHKHQQD